MNVNVPAMTARATPACAACADTAPMTSPPAELDDDGMVALLVIEGVSVRV